jgi:hypothetical protein
MKYIGIAGIVLGAILVVVSEVTGLKNYNGFLALSLLLIVAGIVAHIVFNKKA